MVTAVITLCERRPIDAGANDNKAITGKNDYFT
jgi:hypothetical protein